MERVWTGNEGMRGVFEGSGSSSWLGKTMITYVDRTG